MFFNIKSSVLRKIKELLKAVIKDSDKMSWEDELMAAKTIEAYVRIYNGEVTQHED